jgi:S1-C subfamily serine protease
MLENPLIGKEQRDFWLRTKKMGGAKKIEATSEAKTENMQTLESLPPPPEPPTPESTHTIPTQPMPHPSRIRQNHKHALPTALIVVLLATSLVSTVSIYNVFTLTAEVSSIQNQIDTLQETVANNQESSTITTSYSDSTSTSLSALYAEVEDSVVTIECTIKYTTQLGPFSRQATAETQGSGFVYEYSGQMVIITNNHVIENASTITVTFADGNSYSATVLGIDESTDLAVLSTNAPTSEYHPLQIISSSTLNVGDSVVAIGSPYGLSGTMTTGIISAVDRTITVTDDTTGVASEISGLIQTSTPINSGNSGGPLMTYDGQVIGITTAIVSNSDGLGFAVPSDTILQVMATLLA